MPFPILPSNSASGYFLTKSLRFRSSASAYLNRTLTTPTNSKICTFSFWVKRGKLSYSNPRFLDANNGGTSKGSQFNYYFNGSDQLEIGDYNNTILTSSQVFRDPSAWYQIILSIDTTQATATNRIKVYVNGSLITYTQGASFPTQNEQLAINTACNHAISAKVAGAGDFFDGYFAEINFIDGQALTPSSFGSTNALTGVWQPAKYTGTYGTNGFYLPFTNTTSTTTLGYDFSGNGNNWTTNNFSLTAGSTYDSMTDVPTLTSATTANYAVMNPLSQSSYITLSGGNLNTAGNTTSDTGVAGSTFGLVTGKWYAEYTVNSTNSNRPGIGIIANPTGNFRNGDLDFSNAGSFEYYPNGALDVAGSRLGTFSTFTTGDIIGIAIDCDNGAAYVSKNNTWQNSGVPTSGASKTGAVVTWTPTSTYTQYVAVAQYNTSSASTNFGQRAFSYTPPTNFNSVNTYNLPTSTIVKGNTVMDATTYTGTGTTGLAITNAGSFKPDFVWIKLRSTSGWHQLQDSNRGSGYVLYSNVTDAEANKVGTSQIQFDSGGFTLIGSSPGNGDINTNGSTFVGWQWQAGQGTNTSNTSGSITSTVSVNATAGFSVVTYTGNGSNGATVGHGLGVTPAMIIFKRRDAAEIWVVSHQSLANTANNYLELASNVVTQTATGWLSKTSSTFGFPTTYTATNVNASPYVAYCWSEIAGFSKFGSYVGNGSTNGTFVYTGFRPKFVLTKSTGVAHDWNIWDSSRSPYNAAGLLLQPNSSGAEQSPYNVDLLSNGFKFYDSNSTWNGSGETYIYMAFAENPFKNALAR